MAVLFQLLFNLEQHNMLSHYHHKQEIQFFYEFLAAFSQNINISWGINVNTTIVSDSQQQLIGGVR